MEGHEQGGSKACLATRQVLEAAVDLHARHHFTAAASVDGSLKEEALARGGVRRRLAYGVWEGPQGDGWRSHAVAAGSWGASLEPDGEIMDAELAAIHAYLRRVVARSPYPSRERVLVMSDCLGALDVLESAWRQGHARYLRRRDRGALLESCCVLRAQLGLVVCMFIPSHRGSVQSAYADALAKCHLDARRDDLLDDLPTRITSRPVLNTVTSDYLPDGQSRPVGDDARRHILWDRRLFSRARERAARWTHVELNHGLRHQYVDQTFIGRRGHANESKSFAEATRLAYTCAKLDAKEAGPADRMAEDSARIHAVTFARKKTDAGVRGAHDGWVRAAYDREQRSGVVGGATRSLALGCAACQPRTRMQVDMVCPDCDGWMQRGRRGRLYSFGRLHAAACRCGRGARRCVSKRMNE